MWDEMRNMVKYKEFCRLLGFDPGLPMFFDKKNAFYDFIYAYSGVGKIKIGKREDVELLMFLINSYTDARVVKYDLGMFNVAQLRRLEKVIGQCFKEAKNCGSDLGWIEWCKQMLKAIETMLESKLRKQKNRKEK